MMPRNAPNNRHEEDSKGESTFGIGLRRWKIMRLAGLVHVASGLVADRKKEKLFSWGDGQKEVRERRGDIR